MSWDLIIAIIVISLVMYAISQRDMEERRPAHVHFTGHDCAVDPLPSCKR